MKILMLKIGTYFGFKILNMPIISNVNLMILKFKSIGIFQLSDKMLEGKVSMPSL